MCNDVDLFGEVIVTYDDVELWLRTIPRLIDGVRENHVRDYILNYDVVNKIKGEKLSGSFYILNDELIIHKQNLFELCAICFKATFVRGCPHIPFKLFNKRGLSLI